MEKDFENYWKQHRLELIKHAPQTLREERENSGKMNTAGDWILFALPIIAIFGFMDHGFFAKEMVNYVVSLGIGLVVFFFAIMIKPYVTGKRNVVDIDNDIMLHYYHIYQDKGLEGLQDVCSR